MLEHFLKGIRDSQDHIAALAVYRTDKPLTEEIVGALLAVYEKYMPEADDSEYVKFAVAADLLPGRDSEEELAPLGLNGADLSALFELKKIVRGEVEFVQQEEGEAIAALVLGGGLSEPVRMMMARLALDEMAAIWNCNALRSQIIALAEYLSSCETAKLDRYTALAGEVRLKCRK